MNKRLLILVLLAITVFNSYSQTIFEKGYIITNSNERIDCLIKNKQWTYNPSEFEYKLTQTEDVKIASINNVKEFGIDSDAKYIRSTVMIDKSGDKVDEMSDVREPLFQKEQLFLKVLVYGKASLLIYKNDKITRFFYKANDSIVRQLVFKRYRIKSDIYKNNSFRQQLLTELKCPEITLKDVEYIGYYERDLERFFVKYNECSNSAYQNYKTKREKDLFHISLKPGLNFSRLVIDHRFIEVLNSDFGNQPSFRLGLETEFIIPFNKKRWSITFEPNFLYYKLESSRHIDQVAGGTLISKINYRAIDLPLGVRYYLYAKNKSKIYANFSYTYSLDQNSSINYFRSDGGEFSSLEIQSRWKHVFGVGYKYNDKYSLEIQYQKGTSILNYYQYWVSDFNTMSIIIGYRLF